MREKRPAWLTAIILLLLVAAAGITVAYVSALKPTSTTAFIILAVWLTVPYAIMAAVLILFRRRLASLHWLAVVLPVCASGLLLLTDAIVWHPDPQGAIAVLMTPMFQGVVLAVSAAVVALWWSKKRNHRG